MHEYGVAGGGRTEVGGRGTHRMGGGGCWRGFGWRVEGGVGGEEMEAHSMCHNGVLIR